MAFGPSRFKAELNSYKEISGVSPKSTTESEEDSKMWFRNAPISLTRRSPSRTDESRTTLPPRTVRSAQPTPRGTPASDMERELTKWKEFGSLMAEAYQEIKSKHEAQTQVVEREAKISAALREQVGKLKQLLAKTLEEKEEVSLAYARKIEELYDGRLLEGSAHECSLMARQVINLRTDLDKCQSEMLKLQRQLIDRTPSPVRE